MSNERAALNAEVALVEQWWKVHLVPFLYQHTSPSHAFLPEPAIRPSQPTIHC